MNRSKWFLPLAAVACVSTATDAAPITYVDADFNAGGNTTATDGSTLLGLTVDGGSGGTGSDGLWRLRTFASNSNSVYESNGDFNGGANTEDVERALTTISGLTPGADYELYGYFVGNHPGMRIGFSLTDDAGQLPVYTVADAGGAAVTQVLDGDLAGFSNAVVNDTAFGADTLYQASLGVWTASPSGTIGVYVDDDQSIDRSTDGGSLRTVYEGVGYAPAVPEPATLGLASLAACALIRRRV